MYLLDANAYIQAKNLYYQMSFCPAYWAWLDQQFEHEALASVEPVYDELLKQNDKLSEWVKARKPQFLPVAADDVQAQFAEIAQHVSDLDNKKPELVSDFLDGADPWLIAMAAHSNAVVVTHEVLVPDDSRKVKIPNVCMAFGVDYVTSYDLLNQMNARFVLEGGGR